MSEHPEFIKPSDALSYWLRLIGSTAYQLSKETALPASRISEILSGNRRVTAETATHFGAYFGNGAEYWLGIQAKYDLNESNKDGAEHELCDGRLTLGTYLIPCYVLQDERRVISASNFIALFGIRSGVQAGTSKLSDVLNSPFLRSAKIKKLMSEICTPVKFVNRGGIVTYGFEGETVVEFCKALLQLRQIGALTQTSLRYAEAAEAIIITLAKVGIVALIDEATGFQARRNRDALQKLFDQYFRKELAAWTKRFPDSFYKEMFRLKHWNWASVSSKKPPAVGKITRDIVYWRLEPGILEELERKNPVQANGYRKVKHHQWLTNEIGVPALSQHLFALEMMMRGHHSWANFYHQLQLSCPKKNESVQLNLDDYKEFDEDL